MPPSLFVVPLSGGIRSQNHLKAELRTYWRRGSGFLFSVLCLLSSNFCHAATFDLSTATIADINAAFDAGALTSEKLVQLYLARIAAYDQQGPKLNTVITLNPRALDEARALDAERKAKGPRGPLHGIVVLAKDVFDTKDMPTSGGFKPMAASQPERDANVIERARRAGVIILAKLNLADWYGSAPNGGSTLLGHVTSPYNPKKYSGGSSSGTGAAMAAWFGSVGFGSDTGGSTVIPSTLNNLVGFSTTRGLVGRTGMMWSSTLQDNCGEMGRSVYDCAVLLDVVAGFDAGDLQTQAGFGKLPDRPYASFVDKTGLRGARIGVLREMVRTGPQHAEGIALFEKAVADFKKAGAIVVDPILTGLDLPTTQFAGSVSALERVFAVDAYLARLPPSAPIRSVAEMIAKAGDLVKGDTLKSAKIKSLDHHKEFLAAVRHQEMLRATLVALMDKFDLEALILPFRTVVANDLGVSSNPFDPAVSRDSRNTLHAYTGLPTIIVPGGFFASDGMPFAVEFIGRPFTEPKLIALASGYEAATKHRKPPISTPPLPGEKFDY